MKCLASAFPNLKTESHSSEKESHDLSHVLLCTAFEVYSFICCKDMERILKTKNRSCNISTILAVFCVCSPVVFYLLVLLSTLSNLWHLSRLLLFIHSFLCFPLHTYGNVLK